MRRELRLTAVTQNLSTSPEREPSALVFVAKVILINIAVVLSIVLLATLPQTPWAPLVIAFGIALVFGFSVELAMRPRRRPQRSPVVRRGWPRVSGLLAAISALLVVLALLAPREQGVILAILGLGGLFVARLSAFHPRTAWRPRMPSIGGAARRLEPTLYVSPAGRARRRVMAPTARKGRQRGYADRAATAHGSGGENDANRSRARSERGLVHTLSVQAARLGKASLEKGDPIQAS
jgi:hypothetical protein